MLDYELGANIPEHWLKEYRWKQAAAQTGTEQLNDEVRHQLDKILAWFDAFADLFGRGLLWILRKLSGNKLR